MTIPHTPQPLWREEREYHTTNVEEQMLDTNLCRKIDIVSVPS